MNRDSSKEDIQPTDTRKGAQHHSSPGKCRSKRQGDTTPHLSEWRKSETHTSRGRDVEKKEPRYTVGGTQAGTATVGNCGGSSKLKIGLPHGPATALLGISIKNTKTLSPGVHAPPCFLAVFATGRAREQRGCPWRDERIEKMHTAQYSPAAADKEVLPLAAARTELGARMPTAVRERQRRSSFTGGI